MRQPSKRESPGKAIKPFGTFLDAGRNGRAKVQLAQLHFDVIDDLQIDPARDGRFEGSGIDDDDGLAAARVAMAR